MTPDEATLAVIDALESVGLRYLIVGSLASNFHGIPRATQAADFVVDIAMSDVTRLADALPPGLTLQRQVAFETVTGTTRYLITVSGSPFVCALFVCADDPHDLERLRRRLRVSILGRQAFVATAEDTLVTKLRWALIARRGKDVEDVRNIIGVRSSELDWGYLLQWATAHGTGTLLDEIRTSIPQQ